MDNKLKGAYAESDLNTGLIRVNKKRHKQGGYRRINPTPQGHEDLASTVQHELLHFAKPRAHERTIRKLEKKTMAKASKGHRARLLATLR